MIRRIILYKEGNCQYICSGRSCDACEVRFECYTLGKTDELFIDWTELHRRFKRFSPSMALKQVVGGKVFVKGSRRFKELNGVVAQQAEVTG